MKTIVAAGAALMLLTGAAAAQDAAELGDLFETVCLAGPVDAAEIEARARAMGFVSPPSAFADQLQPAGGGDVIGWWRASEGRAEFVLSGEVPVPNAPFLDSDVCAVAVTPSVQGIREELGNRLDVGEPTSSNGQDIYSFAFEDGEPIPASMDDRDTAIRLISGAMHLGMANQDPQRDQSLMLIMALKLAQ